jgi:hypothetical protein
VGNIGLFAAVDHENRIGARILNQNLTPFTKGYDMRRCHSGGKPHNPLLVELGMMVLISGNPVKLQFKTPHEAQRFSLKVSNTTFLRGFKAHLRGCWVTVGRRDKCSMA